MPAHSDKYLKSILTTQHVAEKVAEVIKYKTPFCISRVGDGEIYIINDNAPLALQKKICELWDFDILQFKNKRLEFVEQLLTALKYSDMVGILDHSNPICNTKMKFPLEHWSISFEYLNKHNIAPPTCCDHQFSRSPEFGDPNNFKKIINGTPINIITPNLQINANKISDLIQAPVSITFIDNNRNGLINKIEQIKESVVLYGVSLTAKDLGVILKRQNKIALDFGATLDGWAGLETRPWFSVGNIQDYCVIK